MNKKLSTLSAGFTAAVVSVATFAPMAFAAKPAPQYNITINTTTAVAQAKGKTITSAEKDTNVKILATDNYDLKKVTVVKDTEGCNKDANKPGCKIAVDKNTFKMPDAAVKVTAETEKVKFSTTAESNDKEMGTVAIVKGSSPAKSNDKIKVVATSKYNHQFVKWEATGVELKDTTNPTAEFKMPKSDISLKAVFEKLAIVEGAESTWTQGSEEGLTIVGNGHYDKFVKGGFVNVDGNILGKANFESKEGSTEITLIPEYLATLNTGEHTFAINWENGSAETTFTILAAETEEKPEEETEEETKEEVKKEEKTVAPDTGVSSAAALFAAASTLTLGGALAAKRANKA